MATGFRKDVFKPQAKRGSTVRSARGEGGNDFHKIPFSHVRIGGTTLEHRREF